jgi:hypothetical protein
MELGELDFCLPLELDELDFCLQMELGELDFCLPPKLGELDFCLPPELGELDELNELVLRRAHPSSRSFSIPNGINCRFSFPFGMDEFRVKTPKFPSPPKQWVPLPLNETALAGKQPNSKFWQPVPLSGSLTLAKIKSKALLSSLGSMEELLSQIVGWGLNAKSDLTSVLLLQVSVRLWSTTSDQFPASQSKSINLPAASASQPAPFYFNLLPKRALSKANGNISASTSNHLSNQQTPAHPPS